MSRLAFTVRRVLSTVVLFTIGVFLTNTFVALGWLQPIMVSGDSMAPHYFSDNRVSGNRILVRRWEDSIHRWDVAVARSPLDARSRIIKRIVGLPGERLTIREGDIWINGTRVVKSLAEQLRLRLPVERISQSYAETYSLDAVDDSLEVNERLSRRLNRVEDLMIETELHCEEGASWSVQIANRFKVEITGSGEARLLDILGQCLEQATLPTPSPWQVIVSSFDSGALLTIDGTEVFSHLEVVSSTDHREVSPAIVIASTDGKTEMRELSIWRDVYYEPMPVVGSPAVGPSETTWQLGPQDYFLVGDNQVISIDSRHWGGLPGRLVEGTVR